MLIGSRFVEKCHGAQHSRLDPTARQWAFRTAAHDRARLSAAKTCRSQETSCRRRLHSAHPQMASSHTAAAAAAAITALEKASQVERFEARSPPPPPYRTSPTFRRRSARSSRKSSRFGVQPATAIRRYHRITFPAPIQPPIRSTRRPPPICGKRSAACTRRRRKALASYKCDEYRRNCRAKRRARLLLLFSNITHSHVVF